MSFAAITRGGTSLTVDIPPKILDRFAEGGPERGGGVGLTGAAIVTEWPAASHAAVLRLRWEYLEGSLITTLNTLIDGTGPVTVKRYAADTGITCMFAPRSAQKIVSLTDPEGYPETLADGSAQLAARQRCSVELTLYRI